VYENNILAVFHRKDEKEGQVRLLKKKWRMS